MELLALLKKVLMMRVGVLVMTASSARRYHRVLLNEVGMLHGGGQCGGVIVHGPR